AAQKYDRQCVGLRGECLLQVETARTRHAKVQQNTARWLAGAGQQEFARIRVVPDLVAGGAQHTRDCNLKGCIVVDHMNDRHRLHVNAQFAWWTIEEPPKPARSQLPTSSSGNTTPRPADASCIPDLDSCPGVADVSRATRRVK